MTGESLRFAIVDLDEAQGAYNWHRGFAAANEHLFPRTWGDYERLANNGGIICAKDDADDYAGLAYFILDPGTWELGGFMVATRYRGRGVGSVLARLALGHVLFEEDPLDRGENIIAHVHVDNQDPRQIITGALKFRYRTDIKVPGSKLPGLKTDHAGMVLGDEFELSVPQSLDALAEWCDAWKGKLKDGTSAEVELRPGVTLDLWAKAFRSMARHRP